MTKFALLLAILASIATSVLHVMPAQAPNAHSWMANVPSENGGIAGAKDRNTGASNALFNNPVSSPDHIVVVVEENHGYSQIIGNPDAVYINTLAKSGALFTNYHGVTHPSEGNYFALFSGSTQGVTDDGTYFFPNTPTLAGKLQQGGGSFVGYAEPPAERDHSPWQSFGDAENTGQAFSQFPTDFSKLPTVSFVVPTCWTR